MVENFVLSFVCLLLPWMYCHKRCDSLSNLFLAIGLMIWTESSFWSSQRFPLGRFFNSMGWTSWPCNATSFVCDRFQFDAPPGSVCQCCTPSSTSAGLGTLGDEGSSGPPSWVERLTQWSPVLGREANSGSGHNRRYWLCGMGLGYTRMSESAFAHTCGDHPCYCLHHAESRAAHFIPASTQ